MIELKDVKFELTKIINAMTPEQLNDWNKLNKDATSYQELVGIATLITTDEL